MEPKQNHQSQDIIIYSQNKTVNVTTKKVQHTGRPQSQIPKSQFILDPGRAPNMS